VVELHPPKTATGEDLLNTLLEEVQKKGL